jgi:hypothetical protein
VDGIVLERAEEREVGIHASTKSNRLSI